MGLLSLVSTLIFALFFQHHLVVLVQVEAVCLVMHQKVAQGQVYSRRLVKHQLSALEHQQLLEEHQVCNKELLPSLHVCVVIAQKWNCLHLHCILCHREDSHAEYKKAFLHCIFNIITCISLS